MKKKKDGVIYTPQDVVERMLDMAGYFPEKIPGFLEKDILDNSCGDGNILVCALERACDAADKITTNLSFNQEEKYQYFEYWLPKHIHGMELNPVAVEKCKERLNNVVAQYLCQPIEWEWDIMCCDSLSVKDDRLFDFVVCNPPYIRVHDLECDLSGYKFVEEGMKDIYLAFYELGLRQTKEDGVMCYITPSSWFVSTAGKNFRKYLYDHRLIEEIYDYGHTQVFENATTYVEITTLKKVNYRVSANYLYYENKDMGKKYAIPYDSVMVNGKFYFTDPESFTMLSKINNVKDRPIKVKNGYATLADDIFITEETLKTDAEKRDYLIDVCKSSTGEMKHCIYPYKDGKLVDENTLKENSPTEYRWLEEHKDKLMERATNEPWYAFGRTQALKDTDTEKWAIKCLIKSVSDIKPVRVPAGVGVYGGLYILCENERQLDCLKTEDFLIYVKNLKKYKSGGYYTFSSKDLENYLNWKNGEED